MLSALVRTVYYYIRSQSTPNFDNLFIFYSCFSVYRMVAWYGSVLILQQTYSKKKTVKILKTVESRCNIIWSEFIHRILYPETFLTVNPEGLTDTPTHIWCQNKSVVNNKIIGLIFCNKILFYLYIIEYILKVNTCIIPTQ